MFFEALFCTRFKIGAHFFQNVAKSERIDAVESQNKNSVDQV